MDKEASGGHVSEAEWRLYGGWIDGWMDGGEKEEKEEEV